MPLYTHNIIGVVKYMAWRKGQGLAIDNLERVVSSSSTLFLKDYSKVKSFVSDWGERHNGVFVKQGNCLRARERRELLSKTRWCFLYVHS